MEIVYHPLVRAIQPRAYQCPKQLNNGVARLPLECYRRAVQTLTIKLELAQDAWLARQARALKRSKGGIVRDLIDQQQTGKNGSMGAALADLRGCLKGSKDLSTRRLRGYGRR